MNVKLLKHMARAGLIAVGLFALLSTPSYAAWPNKDITLIIPASPGGGFDTYARILARTMEKHLPEGTKVIPRNISGAHGRKGASAAFHAKADGYTFAIFNVPGIITPVINHESVGYDIDKIDWLGSMAVGQYMIVVSKDSPVNSVADLKAMHKEIKFTGYGASGLVANKIMCSEVGLKCQIISGYPGNSDALVGVVRGDAMASLPPITTAAAFNVRKDLKGVLLLSRKKSADFPETQTAVEAGYPSLANLGLVRAFGMPPGVPAEARAGLEKAFAAALADPDLKKWAVKTNSPLDPMTGPELRDLIKGQTALLMKYKSVVTK